MQCADVFHLMSVRTMVVRAGDGLHLGTQVKRIAIAALLLSALPAVAAASQPASGQPMTATYSQRDLLKNWAFSACLAAVSNDAGTKADANATAGAYLEFGRQGIEAYNELHKLVDAYAARRYAGSTGAEYNTMKCIDLLHSAELDRLATRLAGSAK